MKSVIARTRSYLARPEVGGGLLFVALGAAVLKLWLTEILVRGPGGFADALFAGGAQSVFFAWTAVSFGISAWLAFLLLRRRLSQRAMQRLLLVALVHAVGAFRFYEWGMLLLSVLPLFALAPALLFPAARKLQ
ncbi:MAG TPA: hypothetical protein VF267_10565 [Gammaproteobacteria bacterium]